MDKKQAIDLLDNLIGMIEDNQENDYDEALKMGIKALAIPSAEPSGDLISRQAAIKSIEERAKRIKNEDTLNGLAGAVAILFELPSVNPRPCEDAISRAYIEPIIEELENICVNGDAHILDLLADIKNAPSVNPQEPPEQECKKCKHYPDNDETCLECEHEGITRGYTRYEQKPAYCDRNICLRNEYNNIGCDECEVGNPCLYCKHNFEPQESEDKE